jgi:hypothetical protein
MRQILEERFFHTGHVHELLQGLRNLGLPVRIDEEAVNILNIGLYHKVTDLLDPEAAAAPIGTVRIVAAGPKQTGVRVTTPHGETRHVCGPGNLYPAQVQELLMPLRLAARD